MMAIIWLKAAPAARLMTYRVTRMITRRKMRPDTLAQSPARYTSSTMEITFCIKTDGIELTMALTRMQQMVMGRSTG